MLNCDPDLKQELITNGYAVRPCLNASEIGEIRKLHDSTSDSYPAADYFATPFSTNTDYRELVNKELGTILKCRFKSIMVDYRLAASGYGVKQAQGVNGALGIHRDYTFFDTSKNRAYHIWSPVTDVNEKNGCLWVTPGSHRWPHISALGFNPVPWQKHIPALESEFSKPIPMKAGEILIYDEHLLHFSQPNMSDEIRIATISILLPESEPLHIYNWDRNSPETLKVFVAPDQFLTKFNPMEIITDPSASGVKEVCFMSFHPDVYSLKELESLSGFGPITKTANNLVSSAI